MPSKTAAAAPRQASRPQQQQGRPTALTPQTSGEARQATAMDCYNMKVEYLRFGCPFVNDHPTYRHPGCVAIRSRMRAGGCSPIPGEYPIEGLGATKFGAWLSSQPAPVAFGVSLGLSMMVGLAASALAAKALGK